MFDLDGTLADTRDDLFDALNFTLEKLDRPARTKEEVTAFIGDGVRMLLLRALGPGHEKLIEDALSLFRPRYDAHCADKTKLYPGVLDTLNQLSDIKMAVVTNKPDTATNMLLSRLKIAHFFKAILGGDSLPEKKPSPQPLLEAAKRLGVVPSECLMVGDSGVDVQAGKAAGTGTCAVSYGYRTVAELRAAGVDFLVDRFTEIPNVLRM